MSYVVISYIQIFSHLSLKISWLNTSEWWYISLRLETTMLTHLLCATQSLSLLYNSFRQDNSRCVAVSWPNDALLRLAFVLNFHAWLSDHYSRCGQVRRCSLRDAAADRRERLRARAMKTYSFILLKKCYTVVLFTCYDDHKLEYLLPDPNQAFPSLIQTK